MYKISPVLVCLSMSMSVVFVSWNVGSLRCVDPIIVAVFVEFPQKTVLPSTEGACVHQSQADMRRKG